MPRVYLRSRCDRDLLDPSRRVYRIFLLAILFGVLGLKGYLWSAFIFALLLYLFDVIILPVRSMESFEIPDKEERPDVETPPRRRRRRWQWNQDDPS